MPTTDQFYRGQFDDVPRCKATSVRMFVSSTFSDTMDERDLLIQNVSPRLREYCLQKYNLQLQYSDMRWGVQEQAIYEHSTVDTCLYELDQCCQRSMATNCIIFLSHRYGGRMTPAHIGQRLFRTLESVLTDDEKNFVNEQFRLDENPQDPVYVLRPIDPAAKLQWASTEEKLQTILRQASTLCYLEKKIINENERNEFYISVTAKEIYRAISNNHNRPERMIVFIREIQDIDGFSPQLKSKFVDTNDDETQQLLNDTKAYIKSSIPEENVFQYQVSWNDATNKKEYLTKFQNDFFAAVKRQIDYHMTKIPPKDALYDEILEHAIQCKMLNERHYPRNDILEKIEAFIRSDATQPCIIYGKSGTGNSSIMAQVATKASQWFANSNRVSIIIRFLGVTPSSSNIYEPLVSIIHQICQIYNLTLPNIDDSTTIEHVKHYHEEIFVRLSENEYLILLLDSLDQLQIEDFDFMKWLPKTYPKHIKCILSTIPVISVANEQYKLLEMLQSHFRDETTVKIVQFNEQTAENVLQSWLERDRRQLTPVQMSWLQPKLKPYHRQLFGLESEPTPLFLSLIYDVSLKWHSFDDQPDKKFLSIKNTTDAIEYLYARLSEKHGDVLFRRAMAYLQPSGGLNEIELEDMLSADNTVAQSIFLHHFPPFNIFRLPSTLWIRIRNDLQNYLVEKMVDNTQVIYYYHRSFGSYQLYNNPEVLAEVDFVRCAYYAGNVGDFPNLNTQKFEITSEKMIKKYRTSTPIVERCLTKQLPYIIEINEQDRRYNIRRINQLCMNIRTSKHEAFFLYDYDFISSYVQNYKLKDHTISHLIYPRLRFIFALYWMCWFVIDKHPGNFAFELSFRLVLFVTYIPDMIYTLFQRCLQNSSLHMFPNERQSIDMLCTGRYFVGNTYELIIYEQRLLILTPDKLLIYQPGNFHLGDPKTQHKLPSNEFEFLRYSDSHVYVYGKESFGVYNYGSDPRCLVQLNIENLIHVNGIQSEILIVCAKGSTTLDIWTCPWYSQSELLKRHSFPEPVQDCSSIRSPRLIKSTIVKVVLESGIIHYLRITSEQQITTIAILEEKLGQHSVFLDLEIDVFYSEGESYVYFYYFNASADERLRKIDNLPTLNRTVYHHFIDGYGETPLIWFTNSAVVILRSCGRHFTIPGQYDEACSVSLIKLIEDRFILCFLDHSTSVIDVFEWKDENNIHSYRQLVHLQLNQLITHCACCIERHMSIIVYCTLENGELREYNATIMSYASPSKKTLQQQCVSTNKLDHWSVYNDYIVTLDETQCHFKLFTFVNGLSCVTKLSVSCSITHYALSSSYILIVDCSNMLYIYTISSTPTRVFRTIVFQHNFTRVYALMSSFFIFGGARGQLFQINAKPPFEQKRVVQLKFHCRSLLNTVGPERSVLYAISDDYSTLATWNSNQQTIQYQLLSFNTTAPIKNIYALSIALVFHHTNREVSLWHIDVTKSMMMLLHPADKLFVNNNYLVLLDQSLNKFSIYDANTMLHHEIQLNICCDEIRLTPNEKYLFCICNQKSILFMYQIENRKELQRLFIENLSSHLEVTNDHLILDCNNELVSMLINEISINSTQRAETPKTCAIIKEAMWSNCHNNLPWIVASNE